MFFSLIIPTFNSQKDIGHAISRILQQRCTDYEILIVDGGSTDGTLQTVQQFSDPRIRVVSEKDAGIYDAMNKGIDRAKGEWLFFQGSDDELQDLDVLGDVQNHISREAGLNYVYGDVIFKHCGIKYYGASSLKRLLYENNICHQSIFYHRSVFQMVGKYKLSYHLYADWDLNIRCFMHPFVRSGYIDRVIALYNEAEGISARKVHMDADFMDILPSYQIRLHQQTADKQVEMLKNTPDYRIGVLILKPLRKIKRLIRRMVS